MTIAQILKKAAKTLQPETQKKFEQGLGLLEAEILLSHVLKKDRVWILSHPDSRLSTFELKLFNSLVARRRKHEPIAYILGKKEFYGREFEVSRDVLIPRPETELLAELILPRCKMLNAKCFIWDVGTGSGAIGITLAFETEAHVLATDTSAAALKLAHRNARRLGAKRIRFQKASLLDTRVKKILIQAAKKFNILVIAANLPYLPISDKKKLDPDVVKFEPAGALFSGPDGLELITKFLDHLAIERRHLGFKRVVAYLEFDPPQAKKLLRLAKTLFSHAEIKIHKDLARKNRVLEIIQNKVIPREVGATRDLQIGTTNEKRSQI